MNKSLQIKICGMRNQANISEVAGLKPDYMGFIFYSGSPRYVGQTFVMPEIPADVRKVGVFVNERIGTIKEMIKSHKLDLVQLHGNELPDDCGALRETGVGVIKVFSVGDDFDFSVTKPYLQLVDYFMFDTKGKQYGGNAMTFDWRLLSRYDQSRPFFLSGGLTPENIGDVKNLFDMNLHAVDVNSGVEVSPGDKDVNKVRTIMKIINR